MGGSIRNTRDSNIFKQLTVSNHGYRILPSSKERSDVLGDMTNTYLIVQNSLGAPRPSQVPL